MDAEMNQFAADLLQSVREMKADVRANETKAKASKAQITSTKWQAEKESLESGGECQFAILHDNRPKKYPPGLSITAMHCGIGLGGVVRCNYRHAP